MVLNYGDSNLENRAQCRNSKPQSRKNPGYDLRAVPHCRGRFSDPVLDWGRSFAQAEEDELESMGPDSCLP